MIGLSETTVGTLERPRDRGHGPHHRHRADGVDRGDAAARERVREGLGDESRPAVAAVVGAGDDRAAGSQLRLEDHPLAGSAADDARDGDAATGQLLGDRQDDRRADPAADADGVAGLDEVGRPAERAGDVRDRLAGLELDQVGGALADALDDEADRARVGSASAIVSGIRSAPGPRRTMTNWPGRRISAIRGASTTSRVTFGESWSLATIGCTATTAFGSSLRSSPTGRPVRPQPDRHGRQGPKVTSLGVAAGAARRETRP